MIKKLLHEVRQLGGILRDRRNGVASVGLLRQSVLLQEVGIQAESRERRAQLVRDVRHKCPVRLRLPEESDRRDAIASIAENVTQLTDLVEKLLDHVARS